MGSLDPRPSWSDPVVLTSIEPAFDASWQVIRAHEAGANKARMAELSMALSHKLIELVSEGVTDPQELGRLALESFPAYRSARLGSSRLASARGLGRGRSPTVRPNGTRQRENG
jgi:hypothetical protein